MYPVLISYSNRGYVELAKNMLMSLDRVIRHHRVHVYCLDEETFDAFATLTFDYITVTFELYVQPVSAAFEIYGTQAYNSITHTKMDILKEALFRYSWIHFIDGDVVCLKEPTLDHYETYKTYDVVFQYDNGNSGDLYSIWCCTGNTTFRNTPGTQYLLQTIKKYQTLYSCNDQEALLYFLKERELTDVRDFTTTRLSTYAMEEYTNGYWLLQDGSLDKTYFFHANHVIGYDAKVELLKKANQWYMS
jgi:hypothetical protein